ncbi:MAG: pyruvate ferredoxin oxidoreductase subunit gamma [bacterium]|nr:pyruvate ferredoxin oxidoreductase subunit gamma [bacterium]
MKEVVIHGRGGQGAVTAAQAIAISAFYDGKQSQAFPKFGVERRGAPVQAFARISDKKINTRSQIYTPDYVVILDPSLIEVVDVTKGLKKNGVVIINTNKKMKLGNFKTLTANVTSIAMDIFKKDIVNTAMIAAFARLTNEVTEKSIEKAIDDLFKGHIAELNKEAIRRTYDTIK